ncbi:A-kinase anchor protein 14 [Cheilinus undulatus]|uniref:A-kinase anchor protein 14 n=1 Tax=Cheilinus undulatus TaxID=241271 RepID=UPI001BD5D75C|nr:A-kinase anchor protein 14 [Cheilinus undulatus]
MIEADSHALDPKVSAESAQLVKSLVEKHRRTVTEEQVDNSAYSGVRDINWTAIKDFTAEVGKGQIREYIQTWEMQPCWLYSLDFLHSTEGDHDTFYHYRARFSTPTQSKPIRGTASVYFVVGVSKVKPRSLPVEVLFIVESNRLVHTPGRTRFREQWLADVTESKTLLRRAVDL